MNYEELVGIADVIVAEVRMQGGEMSDTLARALAAWSNAR